MGRPDGETKGGRGARVDDDDAWQRGAGVAVSASMIVFIDTRASAPDLIAQRPPDPSSAVLDHTRPSCAAGTSAAHGAAQDL